MQNLISITADELAAVSGGQALTAAERARASVGTPERCSYVKEHLGLLGATPAELNRVPRNPRLTAAPFTSTSLKDRLQSENFFHCRTPEGTE
jgi:hypothetical protein